MNTGGIESSQILLFVVVCCGLMLLIVSCWCLLWVVVGCDGGCGTLVDAMGRGLKSTACADAHGCEWAWLAIERLGRLRRRLGVAGDRVRSRTLEAAIGRG